MANETNQKNQQQSGMKQNQSDRTQTGGFSGSKDQELDQNQSSTGSTTDASNPSSTRSQNR